MSELTEEKINELMNNMGLENSNNEEETDEIEDSEQTIESIDTIEKFAKKIEQVHSSRNVPNQVQENQESQENLTEEKINELMNNMGLENSNNEEETDEIEDNEQTKENSLFYENDVYDVLLSMNISMDEAEEIVNHIAYYISENDETVSVVDFYDLIEELKAYPIADDQIESINTIEKLIQKIEQNKITTPVENSDIGDLSQNGQYYSEMLVKSILVDLNFKTKDIKNILKKVKKNAIWDENRNFIENEINYYDLIEVLNKKYNVPKEIDSIEKFNNMAYPVILKDEVLEYDELIKGMNALNIEKKEQQRIVSDLKKVSDYSNNKVYYSKENIEETLRSLGYGPDVIDDIITVNIDWNTKQRIIDRMAKCYFNPTAVNFDDIYILNLYINRNGRKIGLKNIEKIADYVKHINEIVDTIGTNYFDFAINAQNIGDYLIYYKKIKEKNENELEELDKLILNFGNHYEEMKKNMDYELLYNYAKENDIPTDDEIIKVEHEETKMSKINRNQKQKKVKFKELKALSYCYDFYTVCKKYCDIYCNAKTGVEIANWLKSNKEMLKKLSKNFNNINAEMAKETAMQIDSYINNAIKYDKNGLITMDSYAEYLKRKNMDEDKVLEVLNNLDAAQIVAKDYVNVLEDANEVEKFAAAKKKYKQSKIVRGVCAGLATVVAITTFGAISFNKNKEKTPDDNKAIEFQTDTLTETQIHNYVNQIGLLGQKGAAIIKHYEKTSQEEQNTESIEENTVSSEISENSSTNTTEFTINKLEGTSNIDFLEIGTYVDTINNADVYDDIYDLAYNENALKSYYGSNKEIGRKIKAIELQNKDDLKLVYTTEEALEYKINGYNVIGYAFSNMYGDYEGLYNDEDVVKLELTKKN